MNACDFVTFGATSVNNSSNFEGDNLIKVLYDTGSSITISFRSRAEASAHFCA